jgi:host factor-I protein
MSSDNAQREQTRGDSAGKTGKGGMNLQDSFLNQVRKDGNEVKVALVDGTMIRGVVKGFDNFTLVIHVGGLQHLVYKHAIAQIVARRSPRPQPKPEPAAATGEPFNGIDLNAARAQGRESAPESDPAPETEPAPSPSARD